MDVYQHPVEAADKMTSTELNDVVLGCMLDALVCNNAVEEAVALFRQWKSEVGSNMIVYPMVIKGFGVVRRMDEVMDLWREIRAEGTVTIVVVYNALIDAQAWAARIIEGPLQNNMLEFALWRGQAVRAQGFHVPPLTMRLFQRRQPKPVPTTSLRRHAGSRSCFSR